MNLLYFIILIPLISYFILALVGKYWGRENVVAIGVGAIVLIGVLTIFICFDFYSNAQSDATLVYSRYLWDWLAVNNFKISITLLFDGIALVFLVTIAVLSLLIHAYAAGSLNRNEVHTYYAYGNLLITSTLIVVLVDNLFVMLVGWQGISICSYLLIGFCNKRVKSGFSAMRTFAILYLGDIFLIIAMCLIYSELNTLTMQEIVLLATDRLATDSEIIYWITLFLFLGAIGKTAQFPLHIWLTDTVSVPTPVLTLIQSCTTVLAGIYLISRFNGLFVLSNDTLWLIGAVATLTLTVSAFTSLVQNDIKRMAIYMSLSQICYVFLAMSVEAWNEALIYLVNYGAFIALLFISTASMIHIYDGERDIRKMGLKISDYPLIYLCFIAAGASISIIPLITASFYIKSNVLWATATHGKLGFSAIALIGVLLSTMAIFRVIFIIFNNRNLRHASELTLRFPTFNYLPLLVLSVLSFCVFYNIPMITVGLLPKLILPSVGLVSFQLLLAAITILAILITYILFARKNSEIDEIAETPIGKILHRLWYSGWRIESVYHLIFIRPYLFLTKKLQYDPLMQWINRIPVSISRINVRMAPLENGHLRWYIASIVAGAVGIFLILVFV